ENTPRRAVPQGSIAHADGFAPVMSCGARSPGSLVIRPCSSTGLEQDGFFHLYGTEESCHFLSTHWSKRPVTESVVKWATSLPGHPSRVLIPKQHWPVLPMA